MIDNEASADATVIRVDSVNSHGTLLAVVQVIADLNLVIRKAYFSSDGNWFMDGERLVNYILCDGKFPSVSSAHRKKKLNFLCLPNDNLQCSMSPTVTATRSWTRQPSPTSKR